MSNYTEPTISKEVYFGENDEIEISFRIETEEDQVFTDFPSINKENPVCCIDLILIEEDSRGKGLGSQAMKDFLERANKEFNVKQFTLFAAYSECEYSEPDHENGLKRLVSFYEKLGFEPICPIRSNEDQIDMTYTIE